MPYLLKNALPASLRKPVESSRLAQTLIGRTLKPVASSISEVKLQPVNRFANLPQEPEDARLTGTTRSLNRRLLALNVRGSLCRPSAA